MPRWSKILIIAVAGSLLLLLGGVAGLRHFLLEQRAARSGDPVNVEVPRGAGLKSIAAILHKNGVVTSAGGFEWAVRLSGQRAGFKAGEYQMSPSFSNRRIMEILREGRVATHRVVIPEGFTAAEVVARLAEAKLVDPDKAAALLRDRDFIGGLGLDEDSLEGYLFPDTYLFARGIGAASVLKHMVARFRQAWKPLEAKAAQMGFSSHMAVTLASIIEAEARAAGERPLISAVYHNRLKKGMLLQADPTVAYGLKHDGRLLKKHLEIDTPFNTYLHKGLPPGPICSPGAASLNAAVNPAAVNYLYFVAKGDGSHQFSRTLRAHINAINRIRRK